MHIKQDTKLTVKWSKFVKGLTLIVGIVIAATELFLFTRLLASFDPIPVLLFLLLLGVVCYCITIAPVSIILNDSDLTLKKIIGNIKINYKDITEAGIYVPEGIDVRIVGSGGFGGYTGLFYNKTLGKYQSYVGDYDQAFFIITKNNKKYVFSCEDRELVLQTIRDESDFIN
jgi:hypothetical protein